MAVTVSDDAVRAGWIAALQNLAEQVNSEISGVSPTEGEAVEDATDEASAVTQLNALLASLRAAGIIATE